MTTKIELSDLNWHEITGLTANSKYYVQSKHKKVQNNLVGTQEIYEKYKVLFAKSASAPTDDEASLLGTDFKFKYTTGLKAYVKALTLPTIITIEEVE